MLSGARIANTGILQTTGYHQNRKMSADETGLLLRRIGSVLTGNGNDALKQKRK